MESTVGGLTATTVGATRSISTSVDSIAKSPDADEAMKNDWSRTVTGGAALSGPPVVGAPWRAHFEFTRINITPTILPKKMEDAREVSAIVGVRAAAALWP